MDKNRLLDNITFGIHRPLKIRQINTFLRHDWPNYPLVYLVADGFYKDGYVIYVLATELMVFFQRRLKKKIDDIVAGFFILL